MLENVVKRSEFVYTRECRKVQWVCIHQRMSSSAVSLYTPENSATQMSSSIISVNMPDPIRIRSGSAGKHWREAGRMIFAHWLASGPDPFDQNLTQSARTKSDPGCFCTILSGTSWKNGTESESGKLVAGRLSPARNRARWFLHTSLLPDQVRLAKPWPGHPDRTRVGFAQYDPCLLWKNGAEVDAGSRIRHILSRQILAARWP